MTRRQREYIRVESFGRLTLAAEELPALESGQVYVEVALAGVCSTDEVIINARRAHEKLPPSLNDACGVSSLGHEAVGFLAGTDQAVVIVPAERRSPGEYGCMGLSASSHGAWGTIVTAEDWAVIKLPFPAPRFVLADSLAPGFALSHRLAESGRRIVVTGLGLIGLGVVWGLTSIGYPHVVGVDPVRERRQLALQAIPGAKVEDHVDIERGDLVVCALPTSALSAGLLREWTERAFAVWCLTHPNSACASEWRTEVVSNDVLMWLHSPPTDHAAAVKALTECQEADEFVSVLDYRQVAEARALAGSFPRLPADGIAFQGICVKDTAENSIPIVRWRDGFLCLDRAPFDGFAGEIVRSEFVGLCPAEAHLAPDWPYGLGHELVVRREGRQYVLAPYVVCGDCLWCRRGRYASCVGVDVPSLTWQGHGGLAGTVALRNEEFLVEMPKTDRPFIFTLAEPVAAGLAACDGITDGSAVVIGLGAVGLGASLACVSQGMKVFVLGRHDWQLEIARRAGMEPLDAALLPSAIALHVIVASGSVSALVAACHLAEPGGTIHLVGMNVDNPEWRAQAGGDYAFFRRDLTLRHHYMYTLPQLRQAVQLVKKYEILLQGAVVGPLALEELGGQFPQTRLGKRVIIAPPVF